MKSNIEIVTDAIATAERTDIGETSTFDISTTPIVGMTRTVSAEEVHLSAIMRVPFLEGTEEAQYPPFFNAHVNRALLNHYVNRYEDPHDDDDYTKLDLRLIRSSNALLNFVLFLDIGDGYHRAHSRLGVIDQRLKKAQEDAATEQDRNAISELTIIENDPSVLLLPAEITASSPVESQAVFADKNTHPGIKTRRVVDRIYWRLMVDPPWGGLSENELDGLFIDDTPPTPKQIFALKPNSTGIALFNKAHPEAADVGEKAVRWKKIERAIWETKSRVPWSSIKGFVDLEGVADERLLDLHATHQPTEGRQSPITFKLIKQIATTYPEDSDKQLAAAQHVIEGGSLKSFTRTSSSSRSTADKNSGPAKGVDSGVPKNLEEPTSPFDEATLLIENLANTIGAIIQSGDFTDEISEQLRVIVASIKALLPPDSKEHQPINTPRSAAAFLLNELLTNQDSEQVQLEIAKLHTANLQLLIQRGEASPELKALLTDHLQHIITLDEILNIVPTPEDHQNYPWDDPEAHDFSKDLVDVMNYLIGRAAEYHSPTDALEMPGTLQRVQLKKMLKTYQQTLRTQIDASAPEYDFYARLEAVADAYEQDLNELLGLIKRDE